MLLSLNLNPAIARFAGDNAADSVHLTVLKGDEQEESEHRV